VGRVAGRSVKVELLLELCSKTRKLFGAAKCCKMLMIHIHDADL
jgi:hypothetical protein